MTEQVHRIKVVFSAELVPLECVLPGTSLAVQGLRLPTPTAGGTGSVPGQGARIPHREFSGGPGVKNLPANAGDMVSFPGLGRFHMLQATKGVSHNY